MHVAQRKHGAAGMRQNPVYSAIVREIVEGRSLRGSENDEISAQFCGCGQDLDGRMSVSDARFDARAARIVGADFRRQNGKLAHRRGIQPCGQMFADHLVERRQHVQQNQVRFLC